MDISWEGTMREWLEVASLVGIWIVIIQLMNIAGVLDRIANTVDRDRG